MAARFFPAEEPALAARLQEFLDDLKKDLAQSSFPATLLLAGGYGRGEGGVFYGAPGEPPRLYNDLEFYLFTTARAKVVQPIISRWRKEGERRFHLEVEVKTLPPRALQRARPSMFYYDLLQRHIHVAGSADWLEALPVRLRDATALPLSEAGRLLVNRGMSLLRCRRWAAGERDLPPGFVDRIVAKASLALADAVLCVEGLYHWSCRERHQRLTATGWPEKWSSRGICAPPQWPRLVGLHAEGVEFKFRPRHAALAREAWRPRLEEMSALWISTFLWCESVRLGQPLADPVAYAMWRKGRLFPEEKLVLNVLRRLRLGWMVWCGLRSLGEHPRADFWRALPLLLSGAADHEKLAAHCLGVGSLRGLLLEECCRARWQRFP